DGAARLAELSPEALQYRTFEVVRTLLERLAEEGPLVVVLEDLHWADPTSVQLAERRLGVGEDAAVLLVVTSRPERGHPAWVILARGARLSPTSRDLRTAASVLGRQFGLPLLEAVSGGDGSVRRVLRGLQRLALVREGRRWPYPEFRFKLALIQEAAYRTILG